jgi:predicted nucleic acid-binding protein
LILFQDTDSICKRYLNDEQHIEVTRQSMADADVLAASIVSYVEVRGVLARARRGRRIRSAREYTRVTSEFETDWVDYLRIGLSEAIVIEAGRLAEKHYLRALDAIILATAITLKSQSLDSISFSTWDNDSGLIGAATAEGLALAHEVSA